MRIFVDPCPQRNISWNVEALADRVWAGVGVGFVSRACGTRNTARQTLHAGGPYPQIDWHRHWSREQPWVPSIPLRQIFVRGIEPHQAASARTVRVLAILLPKAHFEALVDACGVYMANNG